MQIVSKEYNGCSEIVLQNQTGLRLALCDLGASIREISVPDKDGKQRVVTMRPADERLFRECYYGKTIGRTAGRIAGATFTVNGKTAQLDKNNKGADNLHGGFSGLHAQVFSVRTAPADAYTDVIFFYRSPDGEGGYFGNADITVTYRVWEKENKFSIVYDGVVDEPTLLNLTNHVYLNVGGDLSESVTEHTLTIAASRMAKLNERLIVEDIVPVTDATDFRTARKIGEKIYEPQVQQYTHGYDHVYFLDAPDLTKDACSLRSDTSGIQLTMRTTSPCVVFYSNSMPKTELAMSPTGQKDQLYLAACLECERFSDGIRRFPQTCAVTTPQAPYHEETQFVFTVCP